MAHFQSGGENTLGHKFAIRPLELNTRTVPLRRRMKARLRSSGLEVTILRPPRLTNRGPSSVGGPEITMVARITLFDACRREDLASVLLDAVEPGSPT
jgi:hypothetical protein